MFQPLFLILALESTLFLSVPPEWGPRLLPSHPHLIERPVPLPLVKLCE